MNNEAGKIHKGPLLAGLVFFLFAILLGLRFLSDSPGGKKNGEKTDEESVNSVENKETDQQELNREKVQGLIETADRERDRSNWQAALKALSTARALLAETTGPDSLRKRIEEKEKEVIQRRKISNLSERAEELETNKKYEKALKVYRELKPLVSNRSRKEEINLRIRILRHRRYVARANEILAGGNPDLEAVEQLLTKALEIKPDPETEKQLNNVRKSLRERERAGTESRVDSLIKSAKEFRNKKKYEKAFEELQEAEEIAVTESLLDRIEAERSSLQEEYKRKKELYTLWFNKAKTASENENWEEVREYASNALARLPERKEAQQLLELGKKKLVELEMIKIPGGTYVVGEDGVPGSPSREVTVDSFYIDRYEVTNKQYHIFVKETGREAPLSWPGGMYPEERGDEPVMGVSYEDAKAYADWSGKRLPTEQEWEVAARGKKSFRFPWGNELSNVPANTVESGKKGPVPVKKLKEGASPFDLYHMAGNVSEWTSTTSIMMEEAGLIRYKIVKGGSFLYSIEQCRSAFRVRHQPEVQIYGVGFRCVREVK